MRPGRKSLTILLITASLVLVVGWHLRTPRHTPPGQPPLTSLSEANIEKFRSDFNAASNEGRLVLLLSPT